MMPSRRFVLAALSAVAISAFAAPAANFLVEWRMRQPAAPAPANGGWTIGTRDAATGTSGFGSGASIVGTARPQAAQAVLVANGKEAAIVFDRAQVRTVYDMTWSAAAMPGTGLRGQGAVGHEVVLHRVDGLRVTPRWASGETLWLDLLLTHGAPDAAPREVDADSAGRARIDLEFRTTVQLGFDEWQSVAEVGGSGEELQVRVRRH